MLASCKYVLNRTRFIMVLFQLYLLLLAVLGTQAYSETCQTPKMKRFCEKPLTIFAKSFHLGYLTGFWISLWGWRCLIDNLLWTNWNLWSFWLSRLTTVKCDVENMCWLQKFVKQLQFYFKLLKSNLFHIWNQGHTFATFKWFSTYSRQNIQDVSCLFSKGDNHCSKQVNTLSPFF